MDSDPNSNQFLGFRRSEAKSGQFKKSKTLSLMDRTSFTAVLLLLLVAADVSLLSKHRYLIDDPPKVNSISPPVNESPVVTSPPPPSKPGAGTNPNTKPVDNDQKNKTVSAPPAKTPDPNNSTKSAPVGQPTDAAGSNNQTQKKDPTPEPKPKENPTPEPKQKPKENPTPEHEQKPKEDPNAKHSGNVPGSASPPPPLLEGGGDEKTPEVKKTSTNDNATTLPNVKEESCDGIINKCSNVDMVACVKSFDRESTEAVILVQNVRDSTLMGNISAEDARDLVISKHKYEKIRINMGKTNKIVLKAGNEECVLQMDAFVSEGGNYFMRFPSYEKLVTPINGAYLLIITMIIIGGMWACCLVRRRKQRAVGGVPYQELEMALPETASATDVVTAEGWDQGWDDDWDGDNAVKSPGGHLVGSISANGLTARSSNKDGWENNWDD